MFISGLVALSLLSTVLGVDLTSPVSPQAYRELIKQGFATNWFKTPEPLSKYHAQNIDDVYSKGFRNVRLRSRAELYTAPYDSTDFAWFLANLTAVVDKCLEKKVMPIISWIHHEAEAFATEEDQQDYVSWWTAVARQLRDKNYGLSFNLFTELGNDRCIKSVYSCNESLRERPDKYNNWTSQVVKAIRETGGNNAQRILILGSPGKTGRFLKRINESIYENDSYMLAEWHIYASGPNKRVGGKKYWSEDGNTVGRDNVEEAIKHANEFTRRHGVLTYLGAWMPSDSDTGALTQDEVINFGRFFADKLKENRIPWSLNVLDRYYDTRASQWITWDQDIAGRMLNMSKVLDNILEVM